MPSTEHRTQDARMEKRTYHDNFAEGRKVIKHLQDSTTALLDLTNCTEKQQEAAKAVLKERARIKVRSTLKRDRAIRELKAELGELQPVYFTYIHACDLHVCPAVTIQGKDMNEQELEELKQRLQKMLDHQLLMSNRRLQQKSMSKLTKATALVKAADGIKSNPVLQSALAEKGNCTYTMLGNMNSKSNQVDREIRGNVNRKFSGVASDEDCKAVGILLALYLRK